MPVELVWVRGRGKGQEHLPLPTDRDGALALSTLQDSFPGCCGLTFVHPDTDTTRGLRLKDGRLYPPCEGWGSFKYLCNFPKESPPDDRPIHKDATDLIVLGLPWKTTEQTVREYFETFGKVKKVWLKRDSKGQSKGFAFIRFANYYTQMKVLTKKHAIDGRRCDVLIPHSKKGLPFKVFVGGCTDDMTAEDLREHFYKYGEVTDVFVPKPFRPFGFVTFLDPEMAQSVCEEKHIIKGVSVNVSIASPKHNQSKTNDQTPPYFKRNVSSLHGDRYEPSSNFNNRYDIEALNFRGLAIDSSEYVDRSQNTDASHNRFSGLDCAFGNPIPNHNIWGNFNNNQCAGLEQSNFSPNNECGQNDGYGFVSWSHRDSFRGPFDLWPAAADRLQRHSS